MANYLALSARIIKELQEIEQVVERAEDIWRQSEASGDDRYLDGVALNLQSFYTGLERILELVVSEIDEDRLAGPNWHQELLRRAATEVPGLRPAILSDTTRNALDRYRGFRHVVRNVYSFDLDKEEMAPLLRDLRPVFANAKTDLTRFATALAQTDKDN
ncbi:MAG: hypothetical protein AAB658_14200 [Chloroflexota bacterium]